MDSCVSSKCEILNSKLQGLSIFHHPSDGFLEKRPSFPWNRGERRDDAPRLFFSEMKDKLLFRDLHLSDLCPVDELKVFLRIEKREDFYPQRT